MRRGAIIYFYSHFPDYSCYEFEEKQRLFSVKNISTLEVYLESELSHK